MSRDDLAGLAGAGFVRHLGRGAELFHQGDPSTSVFVLVSGRVELTSLAPSGSRRWHTVVDGPQLLGELSVLADTTRSAGAIALTPVSVWSCRGDAFVAFVAAQPSAATALLRAVAQQVSSYAELVEDLLFLDLRARVAKRLLQLVSPRLDVPPEDGTTLPDDVTHADLATLAGGSRENVSRIMSDLQRRGVVSRRGRRYVLHDVGALRALAGVEPCPSN